MAEFRTALNLDPQNEFAQQRVRDALGTAACTHRRPAANWSTAPTSITAKPFDGRHDFHYRGDSRGLLTAIATSYGLSVVFDDTFPEPPRALRSGRRRFRNSDAGRSAITKTFRSRLGRR